MRGATLLSLLAPPCTLAFNPLFYVRGNISLAGLSCRQLFYPEHTAQLLPFDANFQSAPYGAGGGIGLSGGIETAIDGQLCARVTRLAPSSPLYGEACSTVIRAVQEAADAWGSRHPTLYFNWTANIYDTDAAELVITSSFDEFVAREHHESGPVAVAKRILDKTFERQSIQGTGGANFTAIKTRAIVHLSPYACFLASAQEVRGCSEWEEHGLTLARMTLTCLCLAAVVCATGACNVHEVQQSAGMAEVQACLSALPLERQQVLGAPMAPQLQPPKVKRLYSHVAVLLLVCSALCALGLALRLRGKCTEGSFTLLSPASSTAFSECHSLPHVLAHEIGHALGLDHGDTQGNGIALRPFTAGHTNGHTNAESFVAINPAAPCEGLSVATLPPCTNYTTLTACTSSRGMCQWFAEEGVCKSAFARTLMGSVSHVHGVLLSEAQQPPVPTEDDLASLFFLYPSARRRDSWGVHPIPLAHYSRHKLLALREDFFPLTCGHCLEDRPELAACLTRQRVELGMASLDLMAQHHCKASSGGERCMALRGLSSAVRAIVDDSGSSTAAEALSAMQQLAAAQRAAEAALPDAPVGLAAAVLTALHGASRDVNGDGVDDKDTDGDGLPDAVENGLEALAELLGEKKGGLEEQAVGGGKAEKVKKQPEFTKDGKEGKEGEL